MGQVKIRQDGAALSKDGENFLLTPNQKCVKRYYFQDFLLYKVERNITSIKNQQGPAVLVHWSVGFSSVILTEHIGLIYFVQSV